MNSLLFFLMVVTLFPLGLGPDPVVLGELAPGIFWVVALLSALTGSGRLFSADFEDGSLEQLAVSRSEERRGGKECHGSCRSRWSPSH